VERTADGTQERTLSLTNLYTKRQRIAELARWSSRQVRETSRVRVPVPSLACIQTVSIPGACGGNKARCART
jgi:hypothetical protein